MRKDRNRPHSLFSLLATCLIAVSFFSCSTTKFVPQGQFLFDKVRLECDAEEVNVSSLSGYVRQQPNARWFSLMKVPLGIYSLAGRDSSKWVNRMLQRFGEEPVIYARDLALRSRNDLMYALRNQGYLGAYVLMTEEKKKKKLKLNYRLVPGEKYYVRSVEFDIQDSLIAGFFSDREMGRFLHENMVFSINKLEEERQRIAEELQNLGFYKFHKDYITFSADTVSGSRMVDLTMHLSLFKPEVASVPQQHVKYRIGKINVFTEFDLGNVASSTERFDSISAGGIRFYFNDKLLMRPGVFAENIYLQQGNLYRLRDVQRTYSSLSGLQALKYANIRFIPQGENLEGEQPTLDCYILTAPNSQKGISLELEGTNTAGDLGAAASFTYQHRNLFRGSETFMVKLRGAYEAISGLQGYTNDNYKEYSIESTLNFPRFMFPFLSSEFKRRIQASSEVGIEYNAQERPEFSRRVASLSWSYRWMQGQRKRHKVDLVDINYVYMPSVSKTFREEYLNNIASNSILKYNYEDLFISRTAYAYSYSSERNNNVSGDRRKNHFSIRTNLETAGNILSLLSKTIYKKRNSAGQYSIGNIAYAQYVKGDLDFTQNIVIDYRNSLVFHLGMGIAYPYGNSTILPFEKRYFSGGANSVRGWSVRSLGPGSYGGGDKKIDFINQSGDLKLDINLEYRTFLFWKINGAFFIDAGNIWTLRSYKEQPGGAFRMNSFIKQIAVAYGLGLRLNFDYFVLRFDGGMKAINPAFPSSSSDHYPIFHPDFSRDFAFHFAVGYPF